MTSDPAAFAQLSRPESFLADSIRHQRQADEYRRLTLQLLASIECDALAEDDYAGHERVRSGLEAQLRREGI